MPSIYYCQYLGDGWSRWQGGFQLPPLPPQYDEEIITVTLASREGQEWCYVYDPEAGELTWCSWDGDSWSEWEGATPLPPPPNDLIESDLGDSEAFISVSSHEQGEWMLSYNPEDGSIYWSPWNDGSYEPWEGPNTIEDPPNLDDTTDVFCAGDGNHEWLISVNPENWTVFYSEWDGDEFGDWSSAPDLPIPDEWLDLGVDLDGAGRDGQFWIYATVYDDEFHN